MLTVKLTSIRQKLILMIVLPIIITLLAAMSSILYFNIQNLKERAFDNISVLAKVIGERSAAALSFMDSNQAQKNLNALSHMKHIELACLYTEIELLAQYNNPRYQDKNNLSCPASVKNSASNTLNNFIFNQHLVWNSKIEFDGTVIGYLYILTDEGFIYEEFYETIVTYLILIIIVIVFSYFFAVRIQKIISQPVIELSSTARNIAKYNDFSMRAKKNNDDELGDLTDAFNSMLEQTEMYEERLIEQKLQLEKNKELLEDKVQERTLTLQDTNKALTDTLDKVKNMQGQLIESEKMASLGGLVAGIAHEVNTPIGISLTATTFLVEKNRKIQINYHQKKMTQENFEEFLNVVDESCDIILHNIQRATAIIQNFKKVAVDQSIEEKRCFNFNHYLHEIIKSLHPKLKKFKLKLDVECDELINIKSYPGAYYQIFSNLIMNSLIHGFDEKISGSIKISVKIENEKLNIDYIDNGKGMDEEVVKKVFEPFVTTRRNQGGTGLGAHILYNIVSQQLKGSIYCNSSIGKGVTFTMSIPVILCNKED
jgi:signal transduction histidine kinase